MSKSARSADSVQVRLRVLWKVKIYNNIDGLDVDASGEQVGADEVSALSAPKVMEHSIAMVLGHLCMDVVTTVAYLCDLLCQQLDSACRVAKYDRLVDSEFGEEGVQAVDLLSLIHIGIVLCDSPQSQLVHQIDLGGLLSDTSP